MGPVSVACRQLVVFVHRGGGVGYAPHISQNTIMGEDARFEVCLRQSGHDLETSGTKGLRAAKTGQQGSVVVSH